MTSKAVGGNDAYPKSNEGAELQRLDDQHEAMIKYTNGKISFAPLEKLQRILDLGAGSGAWAILAAKQYPDAEVVAVDMAPLPDRPLPPNLKFQQLNVMDPLPFDANSFDVVHARFVLQHLPTPEDVLARVSALVKPGGWLLFEDNDFPVVSSEHAKAILETFSKYREFRQSKGLHVDIASELEPLIRGTGSYDIVNVHKVPVPINVPVEDEDPAQFGQQITLSINRFIGGSVTDYAQQSWLTPELQKGWREEFSTQPWTGVLPLFFVWAQKRA